MPGAAHLEDLCLRVADTYDGEVQRALRTTVALIEVEVAGWDSPLSRYSSSSPSSACSRPWWVLEFWAGCRRQRARRQRPSWSC
jgi:hypothetical protein